MQKVGLEWNEPKKLFRLVDLFKCDISISYSYFCTPIQWLLRSKFKQIINSEEEVIEYSTVVT